MHRISGIFYYPTGYPDRHHYYLGRYGWKEVRLKFDIIKLLILFYTNILHISMHIRNAIISYTMLQNYNLFSYRFFFFRRHFLGIRLDIRKISDILLKEIAFSDIGYPIRYPMLHSARISNIRYPIILRSGVCLINNLQSK